MWPEKIPSEYRNNIIWLMSLKFVFSRGSSKFPKAHEPISIVSLFVHLNFNEKEGFREQMKFVRKSLIICTLSTKVKLIAYLLSEKIPSEY